MKKNQVSKPKGKKDFPAYPLYPPGEDIYNNDIEITDVDPEDPTKLKTPNEKPDARNEKDFKDDVTGGDLDAPGSDLFDEDEEVPGLEDEENSYYSIGGDNHNDLEENKGD